MDQIPTHILLQMQQEQERDQVTGNAAEIKQLEINSLLKNDVIASKEILSDGKTDTDKSDREDEDDDDITDDKREEGEESRTEEEIEEADFVSWFGSLKDEEAVRPKEEAVQVRRLLQKLLYRSALNHAVLCCTILCCSVLHCTVLYFTVLGRIYFYDCDAPTRLPPKSDNFSSIMDPSPSLLLNHNRYSRVTGSVDVGSWLYTVHFKEGGSSQV